MPAGIGENVGKIQEQGCEKSFHGCKARTPETNSAPRISVAQELDLGKKKEI